MSKHLDQQWKIDATVKLQSSKGEVEISFSYP
jgi:hypothetical protein